MKTLDLEQKENTNCFLVIEILRLKLRLKLATGKDIIETHTQSFDCTLRIFHFIATGLNQLKSLCWTEEAVDWGKNESYLPDLYKKSRKNFA